MLLCFVAFMLLTAKVNIQHFPTFRQPSIEKIMLHAF